MIPERDLVDQIFALQADVAKLHKKLGVANQQVEALKATIEAETLRAKMLDTVHQFTLKQNSDLKTALAVIVGEAANAEEMGDVAERALKASEKREDDIRCKATKDGLRCQKILYNDGNSPHDKNHVGYTNDGGKIRWDD